MLTHGWLHTFVLVCGIKTGSKRITSSLVPGTRPKQERENITDCHVYGHVIHSVSEVMIKVSVTLGLYIRLG